VNNTTISGNTTNTGNNANYDSNTKASGQAMTDTVGHASHEQKLNILKQQSGADFDRQYMQMMVNDHIKAVKMFEKASNYSDAEVKAFATKNLPVLREHLASAQSILSSLQSTNQPGKKSGNQ
jgi:putative membrane protein